MSASPLATETQAKSMAAAAKGRKAGAVLAGKEPGEYVPLSKKIQIIYVNLKIGDNFTA